MSTKSKSGFFSKESILALAMGISLSVTYVAAAPTNRVAPESSESTTDVRKDLDVSEKAKLRKSIKEAIAKLAELNSTLSDCCEAITTQRIPKFALDNEPFTFVTGYLREIEVAMKDKWSELNSIPVIGDDAKALRKALAVARSRSAQNAAMLQQMKGNHTEIESAIDMDALYGLAKDTTNRINGLNV